MAKKKWLGTVIIVAFTLFSLVGVYLLAGDVFDIHQSLRASSTVAGATLWTGTSPQVSLADAATRAENEARAWANDAVLSKVEATWRPTGEWTEVESPPVSWSFYYYSPAQGAVKSIAMQGEEIFSTPATMIPNSLTPLANFPPAQGIDVAWLTFRAAGGEDFLKEHSAAVHFRLQMVSGKPVWIVLAFTPEARLQFSIDAETGLLVQQ